MAAQCLGHVAWLAPRPAWFIAPAGARLSLYYCCCCWYREILPRASLTRPCGCRVTADLTSVHAFKDVVPSSWASCETSWHTSSIQYSHSNVFNVRNIMRYYYILMKNIIFMLYYCETSPFSYIHVFYKHAVQVWWLNTDMLCVNRKEFNRLM
jgi:hypothetical protein